MHTYTIQITDEQQALLERYAAEINALIPDRTRPIEAHIEILFGVGLRDAERLWSLQAEAEVTA